MAIAVIEPGNGIRGIPLEGTKPEVAAQLRAVAGADHGGDEDIWLVQALGAELYFDTSERLAIVQVDDPDATLSGVTVIGKLLHEVLPMLERRGFKNFVWRVDSDLRGFLADDSQPNTRTPDQLLALGVLWSKDQGVGLIVYLGRVRGVFSARCEDRKAIRPVEDADIELSKLPDLEMRLLQAYQTPFNPMIVLLSLFLVFSLLGVGYLALQYQQRWINNAIQTTGTVATGSNVTQLHVDYAVGGTQYQLVLGPQDFYVAPAEGESVDLWYLPEAPDDALPLARKSDIAFTRRGPWAIAVLAAFAVITAIYSFVRGKK